MDKKKDPVRVVSARFTLINRALHPGRGMVKFMGAIPCSEGTGSLTSSPI